MLTAERLREVLTYNPATGEFIWNIPSRNTKPGQPAGYCRGGYRQIGIDGVIYYAHRLAWLYMMGDFPSRHIDHKDGDRSNNVWSNLREANPGDNNQNMGPRSDNSTGFKGVWVNAYGTYSAQIQVNGKRHCLGNHPTAEDAHKAYLAAKRRLHSFQPVPRDERKTAA